MKKIIFRAVSLLVLAAMTLSMLSLTKDGVTAPDGKDGKDGLTPYIGENGNWWLGDVDSGTPAGGIAGKNGTAGKNGADGKDGADGANGSNGIDGVDGKDAYTVAVEHGFTGTYEDWRQLSYSETNTITNTVLNTNDLDTLITDLWQRSSFVNVSAFVKPNTGKDVSAELQAVIDANPNKTLYFPDGVYMIKSPLKTSAEADKSVSFRLTNHAQLKATSDWTGGEEDALIMIGALDTENASADARAPFIEGGIFNGNGKANGISVVSGEGVRLENISMKFTKTGIHIQKGAVADVIIVNIVGDATATAIGVLCDSNGSTIDGMRIARVNKGVVLRGSNNYLRDIHPLYTSGNNEKYLTSYAFYEDVHPDGGSGANNWYDFCYSDQFRTGYRLLPGSQSVFNDCFTMWYSNYGDEIGFECESNFCAIVKSTKISFRSDSDYSNNAYLKMTEVSGTGLIEHHITSDGYCDDKTYKNFVVEYTRGIS